jgi:two-component system sensor histidine kinase QseC
MTASAPRFASLRTRLLASLLGASVLVWLPVAWWNYLDARHEAEELLDAQLAQTARLLLAQTRHELVDEAEDHLSAFEALDTRELHPYEQKLLYRVSNARDGRQLLASPNPPPPVPAAATGYADVTRDGVAWRVLVTEDSGRQLRVEVAQAAAIRHELARHVAMHLTLPLGIGLPLLGLLIYLLVGRGLRPLNDLAGKVAARTETNLAPVGEAALPAEARPLVKALNSLLARLNQALEQERRFTADAAHELRTPLAALKVQAQVALASPREADRRHALEQVLAGTDRATRLVEQLLRLARLDPLAGLDQTRSVNLVELLEEVRHELAEPARRLGQRLVRHDVGQASAVVGDPDLLALALRNLVENALRHTPAGSVIELGAVAAAGETRLWVADNGPGVAPEELERLRERFYRGRDTHHEGSGLGLAIVQRVAELHGARLELENRPEGGLLAALVWRDAGSI